MAVPHPAALHFQRITSPRNAPHHPYTRPQRLEWLAHTLGHELVHAAIANSCPPQQADSAWMRSSGGHGPLFQRLNRHLMGHSSAYNCAVGWARGGRKYAMAAAGGRLGRRPV